MEQKEISTQQLEQFLPRLTSIAKEWSVQPEFIAKLINGYLRMRDQQRTVYQSIETPNSLKEYYLNLAILKTKQQMPLLDQERAYLLSLPLKEGVTLQVFQERYEDYQMTRAQEFLDCYQLAERILNQFFNLEIDEDKFPALTRKRQRLERRFKNPDHCGSECKTPKERDEMLNNILKANKEFKQMAEERGINHLSLSFVNAALSIYQIQQNIKELIRVKTGEAFYLLTRDEARQLMRPIDNIDDKIHNFVCEVLFQCGGHLGAMQELYKSVES